MQVSAAPSYHRPLPLRDLVLAEGTYGMPAYFPATPSTDNVFRPPVRLSDLTDAQLSCLQTDLRMFFLDVSNDVLALTERIDAERACRA